jgi:SAM-dependent methyltransferase
MSERARSFNKCRICGGADIGPWKRPGFLACRDCGIILLETPVFSDIKYKGVSEDEIYGTSKLRLFRRALAELDRRAPGRGKLLDVGCAAGDFIELAVKDGWQAEGLEISPSLYEKCRSKDFKVYNRILEELDLPAGTYGAVVFYDVLSLVADPGGIVDIAFRLLKPGGVIMIRELNAVFHLKAGEIGDLRFLRPLGLKPGVQHNWNFTPAALRELLEKRGFKNVKIENAGPTKGDPYKTGGWFGSVFVGLFKSVYYPLARLVYHVTFGKCLIASSLFAAGEKS